MCVCVFVYMQVKGLTKAQRNEKLKKIQEMFQKAREYSDDKVQIAMQMYEMVSLCVCVYPSFPEIMNSLTPNAIKPISRKVWLVELTTTKCVLVRGDGGQYLGRVATHYSKVPLTPYLPRQHELRGYVHRSASNTIFFYISG